MADALYQTRLLAVHLFRKKARKEAIRGGASRFGPKIRLEQTLALANGQCPASVVVSCFETGQGFLSRKHQKLGLRKRRRMRLVKVRVRKRKGERTISRKAITNLQTR